MDAVEPRVLALLEGGDAREAASAAILGYGQQILAYLSRLLDGDDALDVFSVWAEDLWRGLPGFRRECRLRTWAYKLAYHAASRFRRDPYQARRQHLPTTAASRLAVSVVQSSALAAGARREQLRKLAAALTPDEQALLSLRVERELSWDDCAEILSGTEGPVAAATLRKRYERLKEKLGRMAKDEGLLDA